MSPIFLIFGSRGGISYLSADLSYYAVSTPSVGLTPGLDRASRAVSTTPLMQNPQKLGLPSLGLVADSGGWSSGWGGVAPPHAQETCWGGLKTPADPPDDSSAAGCSSLIHLYR